ncbi:hypothetical protein MM424_005100 [Salmonella enterica]|nr:hypothetical protein [Salmonella enterica]
MKKSVVITACIAAGLTTCWTADAVTTSTGTAVTAYVDVAANLPAPTVAWTPGVATNQMSTGTLLGTLTVSNGCDQCVVSVSGTGVPGSTPDSLKSLNYEGSAAPNAPKINYEFYFNGAAASNGIIEDAGEKKVELRADGAVSVPFAGRYSTVLTVFNVRK